MANPAEDLTFYALSRYIDDKCPSKGVVGGESCPYAGESVINEFEKIEETLSFPDHQTAPYHQQPGVSIISLVSRILAINDYALRNSICRDVHKALISICSGCLQQCQAPNLHTQAMPQKIAA
jgi:hypothetical protein